MNILMLQLSSGSCYFLIASPHLDSNINFSVPLLTPLMWKPNSHN